MESETLADLSPAMATPVFGTGKRRVPGSTITGQTEEESQFLSSLSQQIEELNKEISCLNSQKLVSENRISEWRAARPKIAPLEITKELLVAFVDKLENAFQYFDFKDYVVVHNLLDPLPLSGPGPRFDEFIEEVARKPEIRRKFPKLETVDLENALQVCLDDRRIDKAYHYLYLHLKSLQSFHGHPVLESEPPGEELEKFIEIYPTLKSMTPQAMEKRRVDIYMSANPILQLVNKVRSGHYHMDQNLEVELRKLMKTHSLGKTFDGFNKAVSTPITKEIHDLFSQDVVLDQEIYRLQVKVIENQIKIDEIYRMRQLKLDAIKDLRPLEDPDEMVIEAFDKYKELIKPRGVTGERAVRSR